MASCKVFQVDNALQAESGFLAFAESFADPIIVVSVQGTISYCNRAFLSLLGYTYDRLMGEQIGTLFSYFDVEGCRAIDNKNAASYYERLTLIMNTTIAHQNGTWLPAEVTICPLNFKNSSMVALVCRFAAKPAIIESIDSFIASDSVQDIPDPGAPRSPKIIGNSTSIDCVRDLIGLVGKTESSVLITGESGTGKELVAEALHEASRRAYKPLVKLNCSALPETLLESELFGHVKGSFTGAVKDSLGRFKAADGGTLFLDEIGDVSPMLQSKLLRVLESQEFNRIGESLPMKVDVRIIAATNQNLPSLIQQRLFREDLYYRLNVIEIKVPSLRERIEDISVLVKHFLDMLNRKFKKSIRAVSDEVMRFFEFHTWPGNVRELAHALEHACVVCQDEIICLHHLPPELQKGRVLADLLPEQKGAKESDRLYEVLSQTGGNKARAARVLGIDRKTLYRRIKKHNMPSTI
jgi:PAS domain S-box-containing protein